MLVLIGKAHAFSADWSFNPPTPTGYMVKGEAEDVHADQEMVETQDVHANQENIETEGAHNIAFRVENTSYLSRRIQTRAEIAELLEADDDCDDSDDDDDSDW